MVDEDSSNGSRDARMPPERTPPEGTPPEGVVAGRARLARLAATAAIAAVVALGALAAVMVAKRAPAPAPATPTANRPPERLLSVAQQTARNRLGQFKDPRLDILEPPETAVGGFAAPFPIAPPYEAQESTVLDAMNRRIRLTWVGGVRRSAICLSAEGLRFACGLQSRASLQNMVRGRRGVCWPVFWPTASEDEIYADCFVEGRNLALEQVRAGFAFPIATVDDKDLTAAFAAAQAAGAGVWNGGYKVVGGSPDSDVLPPIDLKGPSGPPADPRPRPPPDE